MWLKMRSIVVRFGPLLAQRNVRRSARALAWLELTRRVLGRAEVGILYVRG